MRVLARARKAGLADPEIVAGCPLVLALAAPQVAPRPNLPDGVQARRPRGRVTRTSPVCCRALRLRVRWLQEAGARAA
jgi:hypothetical protein